MANEIQRFDILGSPGSGEFTLTFDTATTDPLPYHPPAGDVQTALEALTSIGAGNIGVTKDGNWGYVCAFQGALADQDLPQMTADDSGLGGDATITVATVTHGTTPDTGPTASLHTPCTLTELLVFANAVLPTTSGDHHNATVTSTNDTITVTT